MMRCVRIQLLQIKFEAYSLRFPILIILQLAWFLSYTTKQRIHVAQVKPQDDRSFVLFRRTANGSSDRTVTQYNRKSNDTICMFSVWHAFMMKTVKSKGKAEERHANAQFMKYTNPLLLHNIIMVERMKKEKEGSECKVYTFSPL